MVRFPRGWVLHRQAARGRGGLLAWRPGLQGTGMQPMQRVPVGRYTHKVSGVPLTGGQAQGTIPGISPTTGAAVTSPAAFTTLAGGGAFPPGTYTVSWSVTLAGTVGASEVNNFILFGGPGGNTILATSVNPAAAGTYPQAPVTFTVHAGDLVGVASGSHNATSGAIYSATFTSAQTTPLRLTAGPQGLGCIWYPAQVTLSTTTGLNGGIDTSTAQVYLGAQGVPITLVGSVFSGNGTAALAIPSMSPGQVLIVTWTGGHPGDTAAFNIVGTMDALATE